MRFQFLGIPPKGEQPHSHPPSWMSAKLLGFQFLGIPPKGEPPARRLLEQYLIKSFQFLGIPPKGERTRPGRFAPVEPAVSNF